MECKNRQDLAHNFLPEMSAVFLEVPGALTLAAPGSHPQFTAVATKVLWESHEIIQDPLRQRPEFAVG